MTPAMVSGTCPECGSSWVKRKRGDGSAIVYCSRACYNKHRRAKRTVACEVCGDTFLRGERAQKYCSHKCYAMGNRGNNHWAYSGHVTRDGPYLRFTAHHPRHPGEYVHRVVFAAVHGYDTCRQCREGPVEHVHHKDEDGTNNVPSNLIGLCLACHTRHHLSHDRQARVR